MRVSTPWKNLPIPWKSLSDYTWKRMHGEDVVRDPLFSHRIIAYERMVVGTEWQFRKKVDPFDKLLYVFDGWADVRRMSETDPRRVEAGMVALIPGHVAVDYSGSSRLDKMHLYFALQYRGISLRLEEIAACIATSFERRQMEPLTANPARGRSTDVGPVAPMEFHSLVGYHIYRLLFPVRDQLARMTTRLDRYSDLEAVLRRNPPFRMRVSHLAQLLGIGESTLSRNFRKDTGQTLKSYLKEQVVRRSKQALASTLPVKDVAMELGFDDESYFSKFFRRETGFSPKEYRASLEREFG